MLLSLIINACLCVLVSSKPQMSIINDTTMASRTAERSTTQATPSQDTSRYLTCWHSCPSTMQYNPICGSDGINYHNSARLECARYCGKNVKARRLGICN